MKALSIFLVFIFCSIFSAQAASMGQAKTHVIVTDKIVIGATAAIQPLSSIKAFHAFGSTTAGAGATTINIEVSNDGTNFYIVDVLSITLGTTVASDTFENYGPWKYVRANVATLTGTGAKVTVIMSAQL
jgi:hypothetical protein